ncbi:MAG: MOSC domain-containing protein [Desulfobacterales bacterium]|nr:MOSC domain-containing protein [Desulfobacterales bacterium]MBS3754082.1 MOSC domain-containing protein [Desulfobacterales bacterium]
MKIVSIAISKHKGTPKKQVTTAELIKGHGLDQDAHAGDWHRQVSFLAAEEIENVRQQGPDVSFGDFAENIATTGIDWKSLPVGTRVAIGTSALVEITQIGKTCHNKCAIYYKAGDCIMPKEGVFARVCRSGRISCGDPVVVYK